MGTADVMFLEALSFLRSGAAHRIEALEEQLVVDREARHVLRKTPARRHQAGCRQKQVSVDPGLAHHVRC